MQWDRQGLCSHGAYNPAARSERIGLQILLQKVSHLPRVKQLVISEVILERKIKYHRTLVVINPTPSFYRRIWGSESLRLNCLRLNCPVTYPNSDTSLGAQGNPRKLFSYPNGPQEFKMPLKNGKASHMHSTTVHCWLPNARHCATNREPSSEQDRWCPFPVASWSLEVPKCKLTAVSVAAWKSSWEAKIPRDFGAFARLWFHWWFHWSGVGLEICIFNTLQRQLWWAARFWDHWPSVPHNLAFRAEISETWRDSSNSTTRENLSNAHPWGKALIHS